MVSRTSPLVRLSIVLLAIIALLSTSAFVAAPPVAEQTAQDGLQVVQSSDGRVSIRLPADWVTIDLVADEGIFVYASEESAAQGRLNDYRGEPALLVGEGGTLTVFSLEDLGLTIVDAGVLQSFMEFIVAELDTGGEILEGPTEGTLSSGALANYVLIQIGNEKGFIGVLGFDEGVILFTATGTNASFAENEALLFSLVETISVPAESGVTSTNNVDSTGSDVNLAASADGSLSIVVPEGWTTIDQLTADNVFAFGNTEDGAASRRDVLLADDPSTIPVVDSGGVVRVLVSSENGIDPTNPDVVPLMGQIEDAFASNGWEIVESVTSFQAVGENPGAYIIFNSGPQIGYSVLVAFGEDLVLMTATSTNAKEFGLQQELLYSVIQSVSMPAQSADNGGNEGTSTGGKFPGLGGGPGVALPEVVTFADTDFAFSMPKGWAHIINTTDEDFEAVFYIGESEAVAAAVEADEFPAEPSGIVILADGDTFGGQSLDDLWAILIPETVDVADTQSEQINGNDIRWVVYDENANYRAYYILVETAQSDIVLMIVGSAPENFDANTALFEAIFRSIVHGEDGSTSGGLGAGSK